MSFWGIGGVLMNSIKIEMGAVLALKNVIQLNDLMKEYINDNDKEPSWDGFIYLYKSILNMSNIADFVFTLSNRK